MSCIIYTILVGVLKMMSPSTCQAHPFRAALKAPAPRHVASREYPSWISQWHLLPQATKTPCIGCIADRNMQNSTISFDSTHYLRHFRCAYLSTLFFERANLLTRATSTDLTAHSSQSFSPWKVDCYGSWAGHVSHCTISPVAT